MKALYHAVTLIVGLFLSNATFATSVGFGTIEQPINLGAASDPSSIPLGPVVYESNYDYGIHKLITAARPCQHGAMEWERGTELNQNLAHVFGISLEPEDPTQINVGAIVIRVKEWDKPPYSPYSREQVVAATIHCLLRSASGTPTSPLSIKMKVEDAKDEIWVKKFEGEYINRTDTDYQPIKPTPVPGSELLTDKRGVTYVHFPAVKKSPSHSVTNPVLIPMHLGDSDDDGICRLLPVWVGSSFKSPINAIGRPYRLVYDLFNPASPLANEVNYIFAGGEAYHWRSSYNPDNTDISISLHSKPSESIFAGLHAIVQTVQPTPSKPLTITLRPQQSDTKLLKSQLSDLGWKETSNTYGSNFCCTFVIDQESGKLIKGSIPLLSMKRHPSRCLYLKRLDPSK